MLHSEPSFSIYNEVEGVEEEDENQDSSDIDKLERSPTIGDRIEALGSGEFSFSKKTMVCIKEHVDEEDDEEDNKQGSNFDETGEYYGKKFEEEPSNHLLPKNYAQFLQSQGDLLGAEEYYFRATQADPKDGEVLMQYAKLVWQLHQDRDKALSYFERAVSASPEDSHVLAAYATFLWEIDESEDEDTSRNINHQIGESGSGTDVQNTVVAEQETQRSPLLHLAAGARTNSADYAATALADDCGNVDQHHMRIVETDPCNPLLLKDYAEYLVQAKGDLKGAEEYYQRAILADQSDGEIISKYAKLVWKLHRDRDEATSHFEQSVQASPHNSDVLAAYASFLWEVEEEEGDDTTPENHGQI